VETTKVEEPVKTKADYLEEVKKFTGEEAYNSSQAISVLGTLYSLLSYEQTDDNASDPDGQAQVQAILQAIANVKNFIASEIMETTITNADKTEDLEKVGAKFSAETKGKIQEAHTHLMSAVDCLKSTGCMEDENSLTDQPYGNGGATAGKVDKPEIIKEDTVKEKLQKSADNGVLAKLQATVEKMAGSTSKLEKRLSEVEAENEALKKQLAEAPAIPKGGNLQVIGKGEAPKSLDDYIVKTADGKIDAEKTAIAQIKAMREAQGYIV
jgi:hypothetical protein